MSGPKTREEIERLAKWYETHSAAETEDGGWLDGDVADQPMSVRSIRLPAATSRRVAAIATARGLRQTELMREWIEQRLVAEENGSGADVVRTTIAQALRAVADVGRKSGVVVNVDFPSTAANNDGGRAEIRVSDKEAGPRRSSQTTAKTSSTRASEPVAGIKRKAGKKAAPNARTTNRRAEGTIE